MNDQFASGASGMRLRYSNGAEYSADDLARLFMQIAPNIDVRNSQGGVWAEQPYKKVRSTTQQSSVGFDADEAKRLFGDNMNIGQMIALDMAKGLLDQGVTDISQLKLETRELQTTDDEGNQTSSPVRGLYGPKGNLISYLGGTATGNEWTNYYVTSNNDGTLKFTTGAQSSSDLGPLNFLITIGSIIPSPLQPFFIAANAARSASQGNWLATVASIVNLPGLKDVAALKNIVTAANVVKAISGGEYLNAALVFADSEYGNKIANTQLGPVTVRQVLSVAGAVDNLQKGNIAAAITQAGRAFGSREFAAAGQTLNAVQQAARGNLGAAVNSAMGAANTLGLDVTLNKSQETALRQSAGSDVDFGLFNTEGQSGPGTVEADADTKEEIARLPTGTKTEQIARDNPDWTKWAKGNTTSEIDKQIRQHSNWWRSTYNLTDAELDSYIRYLQDSATNYVTEADARQYLISAGVANPTQEEIRQFTGSRDKAATQSQIQRVGPYIQQQKQNPGITLQDLGGRTRISDWVTGAVRDMFRLIGVDARAIAISENNRQRLQEINQALAAGQSAYLNAQLEQLQSGAITALQFQSEARAAGVTDSVISKILDIDKAAKDKSRAVQDVIRDLTDVGSDLSMSAAAQRLRSSGLGFTEGEINALQTALTDEFTIGAALRNTKTQIIQDYTAWNSTLGRDGALERLILAGISENDALGILNTVDDSVAAQRNRKAIAEDAVQEFSQNTGLFTEARVRELLRDANFPNKTADSLILYARGVREGKNPTPGELELAAVYAPRDDGFVAIGGGYLARFVRAEDGTVGIAEVKDYSGKNANEMFFDSQAGKFLTLQKIPGAISAQNRSIGSFDSRDVASVKARLIEAIRMSNITGRFDEKINPADLTEKEMGQFVENYAKATPAQRRALLQGVDAQTYTVINDYLQSYAGTAARTSGQTYTPAIVPGAIKASDYTNYMQTAKAGLRGAAADLVGLGTRAGQVMGEIFGYDTPALNKLQNLMTKDKETNMDKLVGSERAVAGGLASGITSAVTWALGGPLGGIAALGGVAANNAWIEGSEAVIDSKGRTWKSAEDAKSNGIWTYTKLTPQENGLRTAVMTSLEIAGEFAGIPGMSRLMKGIPITGDVGQLVNAAKNFGVGLGNEQVSELLTTSAQMAADKWLSVGLGKNATWEDYKNALVDTAIATTAAVGVAGSTGTAIQNLRNAARTANPFSEDTRESSVTPTLPSLAQVYKDAGVSQGDINQIMAGIAGTIRDGGVGIADLKKSTTDTLQNLGVTGARAGSLANEMVDRVLNENLTNVLVSAGVNQDQITAVLPQMKSSLTQEVGATDFSNSAIQVMLNANISVPDATEALLDAGASATDVVSSVAESTKDAAKIGQSIKITQDEGLALDTKTISSSLRYANLQPLSIVDSFKRAGVTVALAVDLAISSALGAGMAFDTALAQAAQGVRATETAGADVGALNAQIVSGANLAAGDANVSAATLQSALASNNLTAGTNATAGTDAVTGTTAGTGAVTGTTTGTGTVTDATAGRGAVTGTTAGRGAVTGTTAGTGAITGTTAGTGAVTGTTAGTGAVTGTTAGTGAVTGTTTGTGAVTDATAGRGAVTGTTAGTRSFTDTTASTRAVTGTTAGTGAVTGTTAGTGTAAATGVTAMTAAEVQALINQTLAANPGVSLTQVQNAVNTAINSLPTNTTPAQVQTIVNTALAALPASATLTQVDSAISSAIGTAQAQTNQALGNISASITQLGAQTQAAFDAMSASQKTEVANRVQQGEALQNAINTVAAQTESAFNAMTAAQQAEVAARVEQGQALQTAINAVAAQTTTAIGNINTAITGVNTAITNLSVQTQNAFNAMSAAQQIEVANRVQQGEDLQAAIIDVSTRLGADIAGIKTDIRTEKERQLLAQKSAADAAKSRELMQRAQALVAPPRAGDEPISGPTFKEPFLTRGTAKFEGPLDQFLKTVKEGTYTPAQAQAAQVQPTQQAQQQQQQPQQPLTPEQAYYAYGTAAEIDSILDPMRGMSTGFTPFTLGAKTGGLATAMKAQGIGTRHGRYARGGLGMVEQSGKMRVDFRHGDAVTGPGDGQSDDIPAMLADGEFVFPADVVAALGNGSTRAGSDKLYDMMHSIRAYHRSAKPQDLPPPAKRSPLDYLRDAQRKARR